MKTSRTLALVLLTAAATLASTAHAEGGLSRAQVRAELAQAQRTGDLVDYETGRKLHELFPGAYAATSRPVHVDQDAALSELPPTAAGPATSTAQREPAVRSPRQDALAGAPWDYRAISDRNAEALARGHGTR